MMEKEKEKGESRSMNHALYFSISAHKMSLAEILHSELSIEEYWREALSRSDESTFHIAL